MNQRLIDALIASRQRGIEWVKGQVDAEGRVTGWDYRTTYVRVPWMACVAGETALAHRVLAWIDRNALGPDGDFQPSVTLSPFASNRTTYHRTVIAYGAHLAGRYDLSHRIMRWALTFQDPQTGGFWGSRGDPATVEQSSDATGQALISLLLTGHIDAARRAGDFLVDLWNVQPDPDRVFYNHYTRRDGLQQTFDTAREAYQGAVYANRPDQYFLAAPMAAMALVRLYLVAPETRYLQAARAYQAFGRACASQPDLDAMICLGGSGGAWLYLVTGEAEYYNDCVAMADRFLQFQQPDGSWYLPLPIDPAHAIVNYISATTEWVIHMDWLIMALAARQGQA